MGIRDFVQYLKEHQERLKSGPELSDVERQETLREAETMVGMADAAIKELEWSWETGGSIFPKSTPYTSPRMSSSAFEEKRREGQGGPQRASLQGHRGRLIHETALAQPLFEHRTGRGDLVVVQETLQHAFLHPSAGAALSRDDR